MWRDPFLFPFHTFFCGHCWLVWPLIFTNCGVWTLHNYLLVFTFACMEYNFLPKCELKWSRRDTNIQRSFKYLSFFSLKIFVICADLWLRKCSGKPARQPPWWWVDPLYHQLISHYAHPWLPDWIFKDEEIWTWSSRSPLWYVWSDNFKVQRKRCFNWMAHFTVRWFHATPMMDVRFQGHHLAILWGEEFKTPYIRF